MKSIITTFKSIKGKDCLLSSSLHKQINVANENYLPLRSLLSRELNRNDLGKEVGSINYVSGSNFFFTKTKALQAYSFLPVLNSESTESIMPQAFVDHNLKAGDIILSKDSNIGETVILDKDYPNYMLSGALYKLPLNESDKFYILAFIKHRYYREQLNRLVPKGATLRHAGTKFLDCNIPFPVNNKEAIVNFVSNITKKIVEIEIEIKKRDSEINDTIETELNKNQHTSTIYNFSHATYSKLTIGKRLDTGMYSDTFQRITHLLTNYKGGVFYVDADKLRSGSTPKIRDISNYSEGCLRWITPTNCSDWGFIQTHEKISTPTKNNLNKDAVLLINRTSRGGKGEYVGIGTFYDYNTYGDGHHNQGIYRITGYSKELLVFITTFMNTKMMRKYCSALSVGSKMKEIKSEQFLSIPIPVLDSKVLKRVYKLFYTENFNRSIENILSLQTHNVGLFHLSVAESILTQYLNSVLDMIIDNIDFNIVNNRIIK
ncbi:MAG: restriction endonuclease subunit S [Paludibacteraceae bacterium]|nr:restriction endonuclease subunit S [Paludibacteraceae bacterium]